MTAGLFTTADGLKSRRQGLPKPSKLLKRLRNPNSGFLALLAVVYRVKSCFINGFINFIGLSLTPMSFGGQALERTGSHFR
jgi:hypothetical protein